MKLLYTISLIFFTLACSRYEIETITGNMPPQEQVVTEAMRESYVNRLYISLAGRKALPLEFEEALEMLGEEADSASRHALINSIMSMKSYKTQLFTVARVDYLESVDTALMARDYQQALQALQVASGQEKEYLQKLVDRIKPLLEVVAQLDSGTIDQIEVHRRIIDNPYYDQINMGTENFVVATFQHFLFRYPTQVELSQASTMVDGFPSSLFLQAGTGKDDFLDIFLNSDDYFEGQVRTLFNKYLFRDPTTPEMAAYTHRYASGRNYPNLQLSILGSDEYFF